VEFILDTGAETIIGEEFCNSLEDLRYIGLNFVELRDKIASFRQDSTTSEMYGGIQ